MKTQDRPQQAFVALLEMWNDSNPLAKLDDGLSELILMHLNYCYVAGVEDAMKSTQEDWAKFIKSRI